MILIIRISGMVKIPQEVRNTLHRLRLRRKYACVVLVENKEMLGMVHKVKDFVAFGKISQEDFQHLVEKRGQALIKEKKIEIFDFEKEKGNFEKHNLKPFFRLHPPRGGIHSKVHYPKGVLGNHSTKINLLMQRML